MDRKKIRADMEILRLAAFSSTGAARWTLCALLFLDSFYMIYLRIAVNKPMYIVFILAVLPPVLKLVINRLHPISYTPCFPMLCHDYHYDAASHVSAAAALVISYVLTLVWHSTLTPAHRLMYYTPLLCIGLSLLSKIAAFILSYRGIKKKMMFC